MMIKMTMKLSFSALIALPLLAGCVTPDAHAVSDNTPVALGQTAVLGEVSITPLEVTEDSRCPINARCVWEGQLVVQVRIERATNVQTRGLTAREPSSIGPGMIELTEVLPLPMAGEGEEIAAEDYRFTFTYTPHMMNTASQNQ